MLGTTGAATAVALLLAATASDATANHGRAVSVDVSAFATQPVVLTGADFPRWSSGPEVTARAPQAPNDYGTYNSQANLPSNLQSDCYQSNPQPDVNGSTDTNHGDHNCFQGSQSPIRTALKGAEPDSLRGYRWDGRRFVQIPFEVDTKWEHYLTNNASGFSFYSGADAMLTYTFEYQPFVETSNPPLPHECDPGPGAVTSGSSNGPHGAPDEGAHCRSPGPAKVDTPPAGAQVG